MKIRRLFAILIACIMVFTMSATVFAAESNTNNGGEMQPYSTSTNAGFRLTDNQGNTYYIYGYCYPIAKKAASYTSFEITSYSSSLTAAQKTALINAGKKVTSGGLLMYTIGLIDTRTDSYSGSSYLAGADNSYIKVSEEQDDYIDSITGNHGFTYNGATDTKSSYYSAT